MFFTCVLISISTFSHATSVIIDFTATVTSVNSSYLSNLSSLIGTTGTGHIEYDMNPDQSFVGSTSAVYAWDTSPTALFTFDLPAGGMTFTAGSGGTSIGSASYRDVAVSIYDDHFSSPSDQMRFWGNRMTQQLEGHDTRMILLYTDSTASALTDVALSNILNPSLYDNSSFGIQIGIGEGTTTSGLGFSIDSVNVSTVPVPAAVWLFGSGLLGLIGFSKRKKALA